MISASLPGGFDIISAVVRWGAGIRNVFFKVTSEDSRIPGNELRRCRWPFNASHMTSLQLQQTIWLQMHPSRKSLERRQAVKCLCECVSSVLTCHFWGDKTLLCVCSVAAANPAALSAPFSFPHKTKIMMSSFPEGHLQVCSRGGEIPALRRNA